METKENPSAIYSKEALTTALLQLIKTKPYNEITITELTKTANVGRRTFYRNFESKDNILSYKIKRISSEYYNALESEKSLDTYGISEIFFSICLQHISFFLDLKKQGLIIFMLWEFDKLLPIIHKKLITDVFNEKHQNDIDYILSFQSGGFWNVTNKWLEDGAIKSPSEMACIVSAMISDLI